MIEIFIRFIQSAPIVGVIYYMFRIAQFFALRYA